MNVLKRMNLLSSFEGYSSKRIGPDLIAGLTVWAVLVPEALAYATIAGVSPVVGLYAAPSALVLYAIFGSSRHLVVGPMAATAALSAAAIADVHTNVNPLILTAGLALVVGVLGLIAAFARLGFLASFISEPVLKGFIIGLALVIIIGQVPKLFGVPGGEGDFFEKTWDLISHLGDTQVWTLLVGAGSLATVLLLRRFAPKLPAPLIAVGLGIAAVSAFGLADKGVEIVGHIDSGLPHLGVPDMEWSDYMGLAGAAVGILLVGFAEGLGAAKTYAQKEHYTIDPNKELLGLGTVNLASGLSSGMVVNGSLSKTAVNGAAGATSQLSGLFVAVLTVVTLLFLTGLFENLPEATLAAVVIAAVIELVDINALRKLYRLYSTQLGQIYGAATRSDLIAAIAAMLGVLIFDTLPGLFIGIGVSVLLLVYRSSRPHVAILGQAADGTRWVDRDRHANTIPTPGVLVVRPESELFYANADNVHSAIRDNLDEQTYAVVVDAANVPMIDITAAKMLIDLDEDLERRGVKLLLARDIGQVRDLLEAAGAGELVSRTYPSVALAVNACSKTPPA
ncbi:MAG TPA: SulP family inorganic anion transporter [Microthrixaceae bacterium]|nr:SulP family inorganic anion transporter [Microthrixaceae bacterium]